MTQPKTDASIRRISVSQQVIDLLVQEHEKHPDTPVMFPPPVNGGMWYPDAINRLHQKILKSEGQCSKRSISSGSQLKVR